jgi:hypothetical protein
LLLGKLDEYGKEEGQIAQDAGQSELMEQDMIDEEVDDDSINEEEEEDVDNSEVTLTRDEEYWALEFY